MIRVVTGLLAVLLLWACSAESTSTTPGGEPAPLTVTNVQIPPLVPGRQMGAAYLQFTNNSSEDIRITRVDSPQLESVEMHESLLDNDIARMVQLPEVVIPAGQSLLFEPGGKHLMLRYPETLPTHVTLRFFADSTPLLSVSISLRD